MHKPASNIEIALKQAFSVGPRSKDFMRKYNKELDRLNKKGKQILEEINKEKV